MTPAALRSALEARASALGFAALGIAPATAAPLAGQRLREWLADGRHGDMIWMADTEQRRASPRGLWPEVRSVIVLGTSYAPALDPLRHADSPGTGVVSVYALGKDYHDTIKGRLKQLGNWLAAKGGHDLKVFVDTAPVMEKPLAEAAGLGWQGKHTNLVSRATSGPGCSLARSSPPWTCRTDSPVGHDRCGSCSRLPGRLPDGRFSGRPTGSTPGAASPT